MRNWTIGLITAMALAPVDAYAFSTFASPPPRNIGSCTAYMYVTAPVVATAYVKLVDASITSYYPGDVFNAGQTTLVPDEQLISDSLIAACIGGGLVADDVALVLDGGAPDYTSDNLIGFGFKLAKDVGSFRTNVFTHTP